jgi:hypothetical protein
MGESRGKFRERQAAVRLQAVDGKWPKEWPAVTETGRIGQMSQQELGGVVGDMLTKHYAGESKSSGQKSKDPGHRVTLLNVKKAYAAAKKFGQRVVYIISLPRHRLHAIDERWHFRYMVAWEFYVKTAASGVESAAISWTDDQIAERLKDIPSRYRMKSDAAE